ncbi:hypothetical protein [Kitasatospora cheerisanensis]|uniref:Uncharacterized protein n=1 Tax=Kitasatospora cheerisanensis KCTC 2395 TaxID=1348663 RepID=A0A066YUQ8_9ACTN|nr:hypothetical protein [Kitasatospora cheerisanensis]KDN85273.1 hypothetical protein KCH_28540 [Kitasatospora cheerisanensis KCTC 2395]
MRTNHPKRPRRSDTPRRGLPGALAASGLLAAQLLGLVLGTGDAYATDPGRAGPAPRIRSLCPAVPAAPADRGGLLGGTAPALDGAVGELGTVLQQHLGAGELPLPGQHSGPDAFAIAARLLSTVPPQARADEAGRASRSGPAEGRPEEPANRVPAPRPADDPAPLPSRQRIDTVTLVPPPPGTASGSDGSPLALTASPTRPEDNDSTLAVLLPIAAGLLLTAAAAYKHRGLPGGH